MRGKVTRYDPDRGTGSITAGDVPDRFVVEVSEINGTGRLYPGQDVRFDAVITRHGLRATNVRPGRIPMQPRVVHTVGSFALAVLATLLYVLGLGMHWFTGWLLAISLVTFGYYAWDKSVAKANAAERVAANRSGRIPETTLHLLAMAGGSVAAIVARRTLRHKTAKRSFVLRSWLILAIQVLFVIGYLRRFGTNLP